MQLETHTTFFFVCFSYEKHAISVRTGCLMDKQAFIDNDMTSYGSALLAIEGEWMDLVVFSIENRKSLFVEPFDLTNTARSVYDEDEFERIIRVFRRSYSTIERSKSFSSIVTEPFDWKKIILLLKFLFFAKSHCYILIWISNTSVSDNTRCFFFLSWLRFIYWTKRIGEKIKDLRNKTTGIRKRWKPKREKNRDFVRKNFPEKTPIKWMMQFITE